MIASCISGTCPKSFASYANVDCCRATPPSTTIPTRPPTVAPPPIVTPPPTVTPPTQQPTCKTNYGMTSHIVLIVLTSSLAFVAVLVFIFSIARPSA